MKSIYFKELHTFFSSLVGYVVIIVFLLVSGLLLWVFPDTSILDYGYASMENFFNIAPFLLIFLIPAVTMRAFADEYKSGTIEWLSTKPLSFNQILMGKYWASFTLVLLTLLPTSIYLISLNWLAMQDSALDWGAIAGSYIGLFLLSGAFTSIGVFCSTITNNQIISFLSSVFGCYILFNGFDALSKIPSLSGGWDYYLAQFGMEYHYYAISKGVLDSRDIIYFISQSALFIVLSLFILKRRKL